MHNYLNQKYYFTNKFDTEIINNLDKQTVVIYRNYNEKINILKIIKFKNYCKRKGRKFFLSNDIKLALKLNLDGAYIPSFNQNMRHLSFSFKKDFKIIGSAHNLKQIRLKEKQGVYKIFISSLFKNNKNFLGIYKFKLLSKLTHKNIVSLGGINKENLKKLNLSNCKEFAGISFFEQKKGP